MACVPPRSLQFVEHSIQIQRLGRGVHRRSHFAGQSVFDGPHQQRGFPGGPQNRIDQESAWWFSRWCR